jgi:hypothetical protein
MSETPVSNPEGRLLYRQVIDLAMKLSPTDLISAHAASVVTVHHFKGIIEGFLERNFTHAGLEAAYAHELIRLGALEEALYQWMTKRAKDA